MFAGYTTTKDSITASQLRHKLIPKLSKPPNLNKHDDDVLPTVKESITTIHSTPADETVTVRGKFEGLFGQRDEGEDMVVDVVGADVAVDDRGGTKVDSEAVSIIEGIAVQGRRIYGNGSLNALPIFEK
ncbi:hypothetical protein LXL04_014386 [Taraxacum kok-saghyz]